MYNESMLKENTFDNKVILITGGGTGLGKSMSSYLLSLGGKVIITSRKLDVLEATKKEFDKIYPGKTFAIAEILSFKGILVPWPPCEGYIIR